MNVSISLQNIRINRIAVSVFFFVAGITFASWASRIPDIKEALHLSDAALGGVLFALPIGQLVSLPLSGWLTARFGSRQLIIWAAILYPLTLISLALTVTVWQLVVALFFFGLWANLVNIAMNTQAVGVEKMYGRSIMASFHGLWSLACFTGAAVGGLFVSAGLSPLAHFSVICLLTALLVVTAYKHTLPNSFEAAGKQPLFVKPDKQILMLGLIAFCCMMCEGAMADWSGVYFKSIVHVPLALTTIGYIAFMSAMATGRFTGDWLITRFGVKRVLQVSGLLIAAGLLTMVLFPSIYAAAAGCLLTGFSVSCVVPMVFAMAGKSKHMTAGLALATVSSISFLGFLAGPPLIGFIAQAASLRLSFCVIALMGLGTTFFSRRIES